MSEDTSRVWFVTGASRGLGVAMIKEALARGASVVATARSVDSIPFPASDNLLPLTVDVKDPASIQAAVDATIERFGRIDVLVNNAGRGMFAAIEEASDSAVRELFDVNVHGVLNVLRAALPVLRAQRSGHVLNLSSVAGFATAGGVGLYGATKYALEAISEALHEELAPLGVKVSIIEPGGFRTDFLDPASLYISPETISDYAATVGETRQRPAEWNHRQPGDPAKLAVAVADLVDMEKPPLRLQLGPDSVERIEAKLELVRSELEEWRSVALSTNFTE